MNYFDFGRYKYRDVFETAKPAENFVLDRPCLRRGLPGRQSALSRLIKAILLLFQV